MKYVVTFKGRVLGETGKTYAISCMVYAGRADDVRKKLGERYEHIEGVSIGEAK